MLCYALTNCCMTERFHPRCLCGQFIYPSDVTRMKLNVWRSKTQHSLMPVYDPYPEIHRRVLVIYSRQHTPNRSLETWCIAFFIHRYSLFYRAICRREESTADSRNSSLKLWGASYFWRNSFWTTVCKTVHHVLSDRCPPVCDVGVLWPNGWMD